MLSEEVKIEKVQKSGTVEIVTVLIRALYIFI